MVIDHVDWSAYEATTDIHVHKAADLKLQQLAPIMVVLVFEIHIHVEYGMVV